MNFDLSNNYQRKHFELHCTCHINNGSYVTLSRIPKPRSNNQNKYLHALFGLLSVYTGFTLDEIKHIAKRKFSPRYYNNCVEFVTPTANMTKEEMTTFIDKVRHWGSEDIGCIMPTVDEWQQNWKEIDQQIKQYKGR